MAKCLHSLWEGPDLSQHHEHFTRTGQEKPSYWTSNVETKDRDDVQLFIARSWQKFPGHEGSGKTSLVRALRERLPAGSLCLVSQDDYYRPKHEQLPDANGVLNFDLPGAVDLDALVRDVQLLVAGDTLVRTEYTFNQEGREPRRIEIAPAQVIVVEGMFVLHHEPLRELLDLRVFVEARLDTQLRRRLERDRVERGYGAEEVLYQWEHHVLPAYRNYLEPYRHHCDLHGPRRLCLVPRAPK